MKRDARTKGNITLHFSRLCLALPWGMRGLVWRRAGQLPWCQLPHGPSCWCCHSSFPLKLWKMPVAFEDHPQLPHYPIHVGGLSVPSNRTAWLSNQHGLNWLFSQLIPVLLITQLSRVGNPSTNQPTNNLSCWFITNCINDSFLASNTNNSLFMHSLYHS